jgi:hypothetical protein
VTVPPCGALGVIAQSAQPAQWRMYTTALRAAVRTPTERFAALGALVAKFVVVVPRAVAPCPALVAPVMRQPRPWDAGVAADHTLTALAAQAEVREAAVRMQVSFPDKWLVQFDCGKLQVRGVPGTGGGGSGILVSVCVCGGGGSYALIPECALSHPRTPVQFQCRRWRSCCGSARLGDTAAWFSLK